MIQNRQAFVLALCDGIAFCVALALSAVTARLLAGVDPADADIRQLIVLFAILVIAGGLNFAQRGHYSLKTPWWQQVSDILKFCCFALFANYILKTPVTRVWVALSWLVAIPSVLAFRWIARGILMKMNSWSIPTILVGGWKNAVETAYAFKSERYLRYDLRYAVLPDDGGDIDNNFSQMHPDIPVRQTIEDLRPDDYVVICPDHSFDLTQASLMRQYVERVLKAGIRYAVVPALESLSCYGQKPQYFFGYDIVLLEPSRNLKTVIGQLSKSAMDRVGAAIALVLLSPVFVIVGLKVKKDGGPAFFGHTRLGKGGKPFKCWKFRSMDINAAEILKDLLARDPAARAEWEKDFKLKDDPRITKIGQFIRKTSIDEIPQLINVLKGEMSLVGPRPIVEAEKKYYGDKMDAYFAVRPGITGLWQVSGRNDITYNQRVYLDCWYVNHWSLWNDVVILFKTIIVVLLRRGSY